MLQVSRNGNLKIPKQIEIHEKNPNSIDDTIAIKKAIATANNEKVNSKALKEDVEAEDKELNIISKIPSNSNDLIFLHNSLRCSKVSAFRSSASNFAADSTIAACLTYKG